jgi:two-component system, OmpR family, sensor histidine kinase ChvG
MASATATTRAEGLRAFARSRIARIIFLWNFAGLAVLVLGVLLLTEMRAGLTDAQFRNLRTQGELITNLLAVTGTLEGSQADPNPSVNIQAMRRVLRSILPPVAEGERPGAGHARVRVFDPEGGIVADSEEMYDRLVETPIEREGDLRQRFERVARQAENFRLTPWRATISLEQERALALRGEIARGERLNERGERVVSVTLPLRRVQTPLGTVTIESAEVERILVAERAGMIPFVLGAGAVVFLSSLLLALFIARPLRRLAAAADSLRLSGATRLSLPEVSRRRDEIGALAQSVEAMTGALADRIDVNERFAADVSHEIKNPLASIRSAVDSARNARDAEQQGKMLGIIAQDVRRLDRLVTDIARASRMEAETARGDLSRIDLADMLQKLTQAYARPPEEERRPGARAPVRVAFAVMAGPAPLNTIIMGQEGPIGQVFRNLIDNAISFSPEAGTVNVKLGPVRTKEGSFLRVAVEDEGPGIPPENLETVFKRFYTQRPPGAAFGGNSGLGLSIARQIVTAHGGRLHAENRGGDGGRGHGARFVVEMPLAGG